MQSTKLLALAVAVLFASEPTLADLNATSRSAAQAAALSASKSVATQGNGNSQSTILNFPASAGTTTLRTVPQVYAPPMNATSPCRIALSAGVAVIGVGVTAGGSVEDADCNRREAARVLQGLGAEVGALKVMCLDPHVLAAKLPECVVSD